MVFIKEDCPRASKSIPRASQERSCARQGRARRPSDASQGPQEIPTPLQIAHAALGGVRKGLAQSEVGSRTVRRSLYVTRDIKAGETLSEDNIRSVRPGGGLHPREWTKVLGRTAARDLKFGDPLDWSMITDGTA